ncbi:hypothetical protein D9758_012425 [Tetrapyrgos nigripes]|uniref:DUF6534 domain-containing protein n=1 Tax=Tetrapyrgos nigripes TaxID=182062 RepID=A0A8H5D6H5_9AGAR|nr:hypothetical protein D9758_012425 [Tetrapyrgos nigripes]
MSGPDGIPPTSIPLGVDISNPFNPLFAGVILSCIGLGIILGQTWTYIFHNHDVWMLRALVLLVFLLEVAFTCSDVEAIQHYLVANFGNLALLSQVTTGTVVGQTVTSISIFCVHCFFMTRVWLIGKFRWSVLPIGGLATAALAAGLFIAARSAIHHDTFQNPVYKLPFGIETGCAAAADILVTFQLCYHFLNVRTEIKRTNKIIEQLFQHMLTRGVFVTMGQICLIRIPIRMPFYFILSKNYAITMFAILNSRDKFRKIAGDVITDSNFSYVLNTRTQTGRSGDTISFNQPESRNITENEDDRNGQQKIQTLITPDH